jgi:ATP-binding cassette subfamily B protein
MALLIAIYTMWIVNDHFSISLIIWVIIFLIIAFKSSKKSKFFADNRAHLRSMVSGRMVDIFSNMLSVKIFVGKEFEMKELSKTLQEFVSAIQERDWFFIKVHTYQGLSFIIFQGICFWWLMKGLENHTISPGDFALILALNISILDVLWNISNEMRDFSELLGEATQGMKTIFTPIEITDRIGAKELVIKQGEITFQKVGFHYKNSTPLFTDLFITILPAQKVGLVGYSGSGKTTFANLILRLFDVTSGSILIDNQNIQDVTQDSLRHNISMIPQDIPLFHRALLENIRYGRIDARDEDVIEAAKRAHAHEFINTLPQGYDSLVGERGIKLSGGQRQRIAIARAILKNAPILILDEATSQLDSVTETFIQESLWRLMQGKTTIVIAHRLSTLLHMDRIVVFDKGKIVEDGTHAELLTKEGLYKTLWDAQVGGFLPDREKV